MSTFIGMQLLGTVFIFYYTYIHSVLINVLKSVTKAVVTLIDY